MTKKPLYNTKECMVCGKEYTVCLNCPPVRSQEEYENFSMSDYIRKNNISDEDAKKLYFGFRSIVCSPKHYIVFNCIRMLQKGEKTALQIKNEMESIGYTSIDLEDFLPSVKKYFIQNVYNVENKSTIRPSNIKTETKKAMVAKEKVVGTESISNVETQIISNSPPIPRRRKRKV